jgi:hypothetical protein
MGRLGHQARELRETAAAVAEVHGAPPARTIARALALRAAGGFAVRESMSQGLLDPALPIGRALRVRISRRRSMRAQDRVNPAAARRLLDDKVAFARLAQEHGLPAPRTIAVLGGPEGDRGPDGLPLGERGWSALIADDPAQGIVVKPAGGGHGHGVRVLRREGGGFREDGAVLSPDALRASLAREGRHVVQERLVDHPDLQAINRSDALQTVRVVTMRSGDDTPFVVAANVKLAARDAVIDNFDGGRRGGFIAFADPRTGTISELLVPRPGGVGAVPVERHPVTGRGVIGRVLPVWPEVVSVAVRAAAAVAPLRTAGWDIAMTADGAVLIEGNARWETPPHPSSASLVRRLENL